ncbi:MAG: penicillin-binding protein 2 [Gammaproteobacteria bacterium]|nr:MAG: penicillin-binding protein 2 [Gammaproteobacteria bacterium]
MSSNNLNNKNTIFMQRVIIAGLFVFAGLLVLIARYAFLQITSFETYHTKADSNRIKLISAPPKRGYIYDRNGYILADNVPVLNAILSPDQVENPERTLNLLAPIFELTDEEITDILAKVKKSKVNPVTIKVDVSDEQIALFSERKPFLKGVNIQSRLTRTYPYDELFAHVVGYVGRINSKEAKNLDKKAYAGTEMIGKSGIEKFYESALLGKPGFLAVETNAHGEILREIETNAPIAGNDLHLTIDYGLQKIASDVLKGEKGSIVAIDPRNGDVLAFVSNPSYDPNSFISGISYKEYGSLRDDPNLPLYNRSLHGQYPPASTIKPFEGLGVINYGLMDWNSSIFDPGYFSLPGDSHKFRDWKRSGHGNVNLTKSIVESVDTYYYKAAHRMGIDKLHDWMIRFNFGSQTGIDLPNEKSGVMPSREWKQKTYDKRWLPGDTISASIGQGYFLATPLQVAQATAITANKGKIIPPHLLKSATGNHTLNVINTPISEVKFNGTIQDWEKMHNAMEATVRYGTARKIYTPLYRLAGKTGTAQVKSIAQGKTYNKAALPKKYWDHAWFIGFAPVDNPEIAVAVLVENGGGGSSAAAPRARQVFDYWMLTRKNNPILPPNAEQIEAIRQEKRTQKQYRIAQWEKEQVIKKAEEKLKKEQKERAKQQALMERKQLLNTLKSRGYVLPAQIIKPLEQVPLTKQIADKSILNMQFPIKEPVIQQSSPSIQIPMDPTRIPKDEDKI